MASTQALQTEKRTKNLPLEARLEITNKTSQDGDRKYIHMRTDYLGAVKQIPCLLKEIVALMPNITIIIQNYLENKDTAERILLKDIEKIDASLTKRIISGLVGHDKILTIAISTDQVNNYGFRYFPNDLHGNNLQLAIDPLKFEARPQLTAEEQRQQKAEYGLTNERIIIGGSLRQAENQAFFEAIRYANTKKPRVKTKGIMVPRYESDFAIMEANRLGIAAINDKNNNLSSVTAETNIIIITKTGILQDLYSICDLAVMGNTLWIQPGNGQNPLEPALYGKRIIAGPRRGDWNDIAYKGLAKSGLLTYITNQEGLNTEVAREVSEQEMNTYRTNAQAFIQSQRGAAKRYARYVQQALYEPNELRKLQGTETVE